MVHFTYNLKLLRSLYADPLVVPILQQIKEGKKKEAKAAFDRGFYLKARELLQGEGDDPPVRYLRALSAVRAGDDARAAEEMTTLAGDYPALRDRCLTHAGVALESSASRTFFWIKRA